MQLLELTLPSPAANLAMDEALMDEATRDEKTPDVLRLWESPSNFVVVGRASKAKEEVNLEACRADKVPVLRRVSGGTSVVAGPGCLMYAVVLSYARYPQLRLVDRAHEFVMSRMQQALSTLAPVSFHGICDLTLRDRKVSGNSLRCKRTHLLYHGTVLYQFPLNLISRWLHQPSRQPEYRQGRPHDEFVTNLEVPVDEIRQAIISTWQAHNPCETYPRARVEQLVRDQYTRDAWNMRL